MDSYILDNSVDTNQGKTIVFEEKHWVEIPDSNNSAYSNNRVVFNLDNVATSGTHYFNAQESYITIPLNLAIQTTGAATAAPNAPTNYFNNAGQQKFLASLKSGSYQLIDKINYKFNGDEIISIDNFENIKINYRILSSWNENDVVKRGDELHFAKDSNDSFSFTDTREGIKNNNIEDANDGFKIALGFTNPNMGRRERMKKTCGLNSNLLYTNFNSVANLGNQYCDYALDPVAGAAGVQTQNYHILMTIRLGDLHPFFKSMPLVKNPQQYMAIHLNTNSIYNINAGAGGALTAFSITNETNTCPFMLTDYSSVSRTADTAVESKIQLGIVGAKDITGYRNHPMGKCYFNACFVEPSNTSLKMLLAQPIKSHFWEECYCQYGSGLANVASGGNVNQLISGSYSKLRKLVIVPILATTGGQLVNCSPLSSPYTSEPGTNSFGTVGSMNNFNVRLGIKNVYPRNINYSYQNYLETVQGMGAINGGLEPGLSSGLISYQDWISAYGYYVVDLSRQNPINDLNPQQITVMFKNESSKAMSYYILVFYEKSVVIDCEKGEIGK